MVFLFALIFSINIYAVSPECLVGQREVIRDEAKVCERDPTYKTEPKGCVVDGTLFPAGVHIFWGKKVYDCQERTDGKGVQLVETMNAGAKCEDGHINGEEWIDKEHFKYRCADFGEIKFVSCIVSKGLEIPVGKFRKIGKMEILCHKFRNGTVVMESTSAARSYDCTSKTGESRKYGEQWIENNTFVVKCVEYGRVIYLGCHVDELSDYVRFDKYFLSGSAYYFCGKNGIRYTLSYFNPEEKS